MRIYVASSWRNPHQQDVVKALRGMGHAVYDFRGAETAFSWDEIRGSGPWDAKTCRESVSHPVAMAGYRADMKALVHADLLVIVLPCGRSAHWEFGFAVGRGVRTIALCLGDIESEIIYAGCDYVLGSIEELRAVVGQENENETQTKSVIETFTTLRLALVRMIAHFNNPRLALLPSHVTEEKAFDGPVSLEDGGKAWRQTAWDAIAQAESALKWRIKEEDEAKKETLGVKNG